MTAPSLPSPSSDTGGVVVPSNAPPRRRRRLRGRDPLAPNSILNRTALEQALERAGLLHTKVQTKHLDSFYQALHRQHYPELHEFVKNYHCPDETPALLLRPLKNAVTSRKNRNKIQLPRVFLEFLQSTSDFCTVTSRVARQQTSADGSTTKLAIELQDGHLVESVIMRYHKRVSLCVSSQCGCAMGCTFCATGTMGWLGNLSSGEILEQVVHANAILAREWQAKQNVASTTSQEDNADVYLVRNIVFMGMGEPLDNYNAVREACQALMDRRRWNLANGRVTVSTVGIVSKMKRLTQDLPDVSLALSLHAPNQEMRTKIVPTAKRYPLEELIDALDNHMLSVLRKRMPLQETSSKNKSVKEVARRRAMIEYVMLEGETSSLECAHQLGRLCQDRQLVVNLIPYNKTNADDSLSCPSEEHMQEFRKIIVSYGTTFCTIRRTMGADIDSACGQLVTLTQNEMKEADAVVDIEDAAGALSSSKENRFKAKLSQRGGTTGGYTTTSTTTKKTSSPTETSREEQSQPADLEKWVQPLAIATSIAACCFLVATTLYLRQQQKR